MAVVSVIGVGNTLMGDDGVGVRVAEELMRRLEPSDDVSIVTGHLAGMTLLPAVLDAPHVIFVDALSYDDEAGAVFRMDPDAAGITGLRSTTSHGMGIPYLITNARMLGHHAEYLVYGIHVGDIMVGPDTLTEAVEARVSDVAGLIERDISRVLGGGSLQGEN